MENISQKNTANIIVNKDLIELINTYGTKSHTDVLNLLNDKSKSNLVLMLLDLITQYLMIKTLLH